MKKVVAKVGNVTARLHKHRKDSFQRLGRVREWERT